MALAIDGSVHGTTTTLASLSVSLTTTQPNDVIIVFALTNQGPFSSVSGGGLSWTKRAGNNSSGLPANVEELWYAIASSPLSAASITATATSSSGIITVDAFGISGANTASPFDGAAVLSNSDPFNISTTNANDIIIAGLRGGTASMTAGSGWSSISGADFQLSEYKIVSSVQSNLSVSVGTGAGGTTANIAQAIQSAGLPPPARFANLPSMIQM